MMRAITFAVIAAAVGACSPSPRLNGGQTGLLEDVDAGTADAPPDPPTSDGGMDAGMDARPDAPPDADPVEVHPPGPFVTWSQRVRQVLPYQAAPGGHAVRVRINGNNGGGRDATDGATLGINGGEPCVAQPRPPDPNPVGGTTVCSAEVVAVGTGDTLTVDMYEWNGYEGWDVQHEYVAIDGGSWIEVTGP